MSVTPALFGALRELHPHTQHSTWLTTNHTPALGQASFFQHSDYFFSWG